jgi:methylenetetrahydrofolate reductase (NADPH)
MFYDNSYYFQYVDECRKMGIKAPIIPGLKILTSKAQLSSIPKDFHVSIPSVFSDEVDAAKPEDVLNIGIEWAANQVRELLDKNVPSVHFYVMLNSRPITLLMERLNLFKKVF